ncbi:MULTISPECIES: hypothetical protein [unclassified Shewanella]|uniref:hypothetical protein n=1 Tax=Shewanella TaxID=22 RepID=UPI001567DFA8|nr:MULTISPECIES: hypothetical protein [unclassified Shewanella]MCU8028944.1 hypothetical protein [Shewanella sp. SM73]
MTILIVEDDNFKYSEIKKFITDNGILDKDIIVKLAVADTIKYLNENTPEKIILDMSLPSHVAKLGEGTSLALPSGGMEVIRELSYLEKVNIPIIILTQYPQILINNDYFHISEVAELIQKKFNFTKLTVDSFDSEDNQWKISTKRFLLQE